MSFAEYLTLKLGGKWSGSSGLAFCPAHDNKNTPALSISVGRDGRLLANCFSGCSFSDVVAALKLQGIFESCGHRHTANDTMISRTLDLKREREAQRQQQANAIWDAAVEIPNTPAERYLRSRGIKCALPPSLRFHGNCWHGQSGTRYPAMIGQVEGASGNAIHRTWLRHDGMGKANVDPPKAMLGPVSGGVVRLSDAPGPLYIVEGIETGLSLLSGILSAPATIWAALSTSGMRSVHLPTTPHTLIIGIDSDDNGAGWQAAEALAERASASGWDVRMWPAPIGMDWNDFLVRGAI